MGFLRIVFIFSIFALVGSFSVLAQTVDDAAKAGPPDSLVAGTKDERYRIGYQDVLEVQVYKLPELSKRVPVSAEGTIELYRLDRPIVAVCKTERQLAAEITAAYKAKFIRDPQVSVIVSEQRSQSIAVIGAVEKPGNYYVNRRVHLLEILAQAGGPSRDSGTRMLIARTGSNTNCKEVTASENDPIAILNFKIRDVQEGKQTMWMQPGDVVSVLDADVVYVYGNVNKQGSYKIREPITLRQAIVSAEGLQATAKRGNVRVLRQNAGGEPLEFTYDLNEIDKGKIKDPYLEPNDIVAVSQDRTKTILLGVSGMIKSSIPSAIYKVPL